MTAFLIWGLAQVLNAVCMLFMFREAAPFVCFLALLGGVPVCLAFGLTLSWLRKKAETPRVLLIGAATLLPIVTGIGSFGMGAAYGVAGYRDVLPAEIIPVVCTFTATLLLQKRLIRKTTFTANEAGTDYYGTE